MKAIPANFSIRFRSILGYKVLFALILQFFIVSYNTITGFIQVETMAEFLFRVGYGSAVSTLLGLLIIYPDLLIIGWLNRKFPWSKAPLRRVVPEFILASLVAIATSVSGTAAVNLINPYTEDLPGVLMINGSIAVIVNVILMAVLEALMFYRESRLSRIRAEALQRELADIRFEMLKTQINPHFLFNSLNVLSGLISIDTARAQVFIEAFAGIYHYVLETLEKQVVTLEEELGFARSYMLLQQIRHGEQVTFTVHLPSGTLRMFLPPLSLQTILENAIKHNATKSSRPLEIRVTTDGMWLEIRNSLIPKTSGISSTGVGQKNLTRRYRMICDRVPVFMVENDEYVAKLPLIPCEN